MNGRCPLCLARCLSPLPCPACRSLLPWLPSPALAAVGLDAQLFPQVVVPLAFAWPVDALLWRMKTRPDRVLAALFGDLLAEAVASSAEKIGSGAATGLTARCRAEPVTAAEVTGSRPRERADPLAPSRCKSSADPVLLPVPQSARRWRQRGFNPAADIARRCSRALSLRWAPELALRHDDSDGLATARLSREGRRLALAGAFIALPEVYGKRIIIIDDVLTSGATTLALAQTLVDGGAEVIGVWAVARTL